MDTACDLSQHQRLRPTRKLPALILSIFRQDYVDHSKIIYTIFHPGRSTSFVMFLQLWQRKYSVGYAETVHDSPLDAGLVVCKDHLPTNLVPLDCLIFAYSSMNPNLRNTALATPSLCPAVPTSFPRSRFPFLFTFFLLSTLPQNVSSTKLFTPCASL